MSSIVVGEALVQPCVRGDGVGEDELVGTRLDYAALRVNGEAIFVPCDPRGGIAGDHAVQPGSFGQ